MVTMTPGQHRNTQTNRAWNRKVLELLRPVSLVLGLILLALALFISSGKMLSIGLLEVVVSIAFLVSFAFGFAIVDNVSIELIGVMDQSRKQPEKKKRTISLVVS